MFKMISTSGFPTAIEWSELNSFSAGAPPRTLLGGAYSAPQVGLFLKGGEGKRREREGPLLTQICGSASGIE